MYEKEYRWCDRDSNPEPHNGMLGLDQWILVHLTYLGIVNNMTK